MQFKKSKKSIFLIFLFVTLISAFIFIPYLLENKAFVIGPDMRSQVRPIFVEFKRLIKSFITAGTLPFWSWNIFIGNNFWSAKSFLFLGDIYSYLMILLKNHFYINIMIITFLKFIIAALSFYLYGLTRSWKQNTILIGSLLFAFSSWAMKTVEFPVFLSFYSFVPLYFASIELFLKKRRYIAFTFMTSLMIITNYYLFFSLSMFTAIYYLFRYYEINRHFKYVIKNIFIIVSYYLVGVLIASVLIIPAFLFITENSRVFSSKLNLFYFDNIRVYFHLLVSLFIPSNTFISKIVSVNGIEGYTSIYETLVYQTKDIMIWAGGLTALLTTQPLFDKDSVRKNLYRVYYIFIIIMIFIPFGGSIMHGFSEPSFRWMLFVIFMNIGNLMYYLDNPEEINASVLKYTLILFLFIGILNIPILSFLISEPILKFSNQLAYFSIFLLIMVLFYFLLKSRKINFSFLLGLVLIELIASSFITFNDNPYYKRFDWEFINKSETVLGEYDSKLKEYISYVDEASDDYYRIYAPYQSVYWFSSLSQNVIYNFSDLKTYDSTYQFSLESLLRLYDFDTVHGFTWNITQGDIIDFASVKYAVVTNADELPHPNFELIGNFQGLPLYKNLQYQPLVHSRSNLITYDEYQLNRDVSMINTHVISETQDFDSIKSFVSKNESKFVLNDLYGNYVFGTIETNGKGFFVTSIPFDKGWSVRINGKDVDTYKVNGGFIGFPVEASGEVLLSFTPVGFKLGAVFTGIGLVIFIFLFVFERKSISI